MRGLEGGGGGDGEGGGGGGGTLALGREWRYLYGLDRSGMLK